MHDIIEKYAGKGTPLCESIQKIYNMCEGAVRAPTQNSYDLLNQRYGTDGRPDPAKIADAVDILVDNDQNLYNMLHSPHSNSRAIAWATMMQELNAYLDYMEAKTLSSTQFKPLSSTQFKRWFADAGMTLDEGMGMAVSVIDQKRADIKADEA